MVVIMPTINILAPRGMTLTFNGGKHITRSSYCSFDHMDCTSHRTRNRRTKHACMQCKNVYTIYPIWHLNCLRGCPNSCMWEAKGNQLQRGRGQEPISYISIRLSHTYVEMNKMCLKSISVVISFPKIRFEIEHYKCKP